VTCAATMPSATAPALAYASPVERRARARRPGAERPGVTTRRRVSGDGGVPVSTRLVDGGRRGRHMRPTVGPTLTTERGVVVALDLGARDEQAGGVAAGDADGGELALLDVLLDSSGAQAKAWCYGSCYQVQSKRTISVRIDLRLPPRPSKSTDFDGRRSCRAVHHGERPSPRRLGAAKQAKVSFPARESALCPGSIGRYFAPGVVFRHTRPPSAAAASSRLSKVARASVSSVSIGPPSALPLSDKIAGTAAGAKPFRSGRRRLGLSLRS